MWGKTASHLLYFKKIFKFGWITIFQKSRGLAFERIDLTHWIVDMLYALLTYPDVYVPELVGSAILIWFVLELVRNRKVFAFVKYGQV